MQQTHIQTQPLHPLVKPSSIDTKKFFCPFLDRGYCREASKCSFSHDHQRSIKIPTEYCHFYLANQCLYGQDCKFRHSEPVSPTIASILQLDIQQQYTTNTSDNYLSEGSTSSQALETSFPPELSSDEEDHPLKSLTLCPYAIVSGICQFPTGLCSYLHGLICDLCGGACLHPFNPDQRLQHRDECLREHERQMELSFAVQRSSDKICGICMDIIVEKKPVTSRRFGILEKCNHTFCIDCIRKWRGSKQFDSQTIRACPECRVCSDFVVPSKYWVEDQVDKERLIHDYKAALRAKPCKYFNEGEGDCPFAGSCFYKHAYPDGTIAKLDNPKPRRRLTNNRSSAINRYILWNILTSADEVDEWSNDELESLNWEPDDLTHNTSDEDGDDQYQDGAFDEEETEYDRSLIDLMP